MQISLSLVELIKINGNFVALLNIVTLTRNVRIYIYIYLYEYTNSYKIHTNLIYIYIFEGIVYVPRIYKFQFPLSRRLF